MVNIRKAQSEREKQYFLQAHAPNIVKISGDMEGHLDRYESADRSRINILRTQRLQIEPNEALLKKLLKKKRDLLKGKGKGRKRVNLKDELAKINKELKIMRQGQFRRRDEDPVRLYVAPAAPAGAAVPAGAAAHAPHAPAAVVGGGGGGGPVAHAAVGAAAIPAVHPGLVADIGAIRGEMARVRQDIAAIPPGETDAQRQQRINRDQQRYDDLVDRLDAGLDDIDAVRRNVNRADADHAARAADLGGDLADMRAELGREIAASDVRARRGMAGIDERLGGVAEQQQALEDRYGGLEGRFEGLSGNIAESFTDQRQRGLGHQQGLDNVRNAQAELREAFVEQMAEMGGRIDQGARDQTRLVRGVGRRIGALDTTLTDETALNRDRERQRQGDHQELLGRLSNHDAHIDEFRRYNASVEELIRNDRERAEVAERRLADGDSGFSGQQVSYLEQHGEVLLARLNAMAEEGERRDGDNQAAFENIRAELARIGGQPVGDTTPAQLADNIRAQLNDPRLGRMDPLQPVGEGDVAGPPAPAPEPEGEGGGELQVSGFKPPDPAQSPEEAAKGIFTGTGGLDFDKDKPPKPTDDGGGKVTADKDEDETAKETGRGDGPSGLEMPIDSDDEGYEGGGERTDTDTEEEEEEGTGKKQVGFKEGEEVKEFEVSDEGESGREDDDPADDPFEEEEHAYGTEDDIQRSRDLWKRAQPDLGQEAGMRGRRTDAHNETRNRYRVRNIHPKKDTHGIRSQDVVDVGGANEHGQIRLKTGGGTDGRGHRVEWEQLDRNIDSGRVLFEEGKKKKKKKGKKMTAEEQEYKEWSDQYDRELEEYHEEQDKAQAEEEAGGGEPGRPRIAQRPKSSGPAPPPKEPPKSRADLLSETIARQRQERGNLSRELTAAGQTKTEGPTGGRSTRAIESDLRKVDKDIERLEGELERERAR